MSNVRSEDTILCVDISRSMYRSDFQWAHNKHDNQNINRLTAILHACDEIIQQKHEVDASDRFGVVLFNREVTAIPDLVFSRADIEQFIGNNLDIGEGSSLGEALAHSVKMVIKELRKIGEKQHRIVLLTDGISHTTAVNPIKIAKIANGLGIIIDAIRVGPPKIPGEPIKRITELTRGKYHYVTNSTDLAQATAGVAQKKEVQIATIFDSGDGGTKNIFESEIADSLLRIEELTNEQREKELYEPMRNGKLKCSICYQPVCPTCKVDFFGCGRFCPNCLKPIHLHCAMDWAKQQAKDNQDDSEGLVFRCPHCFYLLKIPSLMVNNHAADEAAPEADVGSVIIQQTTFDQASPAILDDICGVCSSLFDETDDEILYKCECGAYFHADCIQDEVRSSGRCPVCGKSAQLEE